MPAEFYHPRYWPTWMGVGILKLLVLMPWSWQMRLGKGIGIVLFKLLKKRRQISHINLAIAFPSLSNTELQQLNRDHFISMGQSVIESAMGWWGSEQQIRKLSHVEGIEHLESTLKNHNVILLGAHFVCLEVGGRIMAQHMTPHSTYRPHQNALIEYLVAKQRSKQYGKAIAKDNIRGMIKSIKGGFPTWYATDQNYRGKNSIEVPFFGVNAPSNPGTSRLAKMTKAKVVPVICVRLHNANHANKTSKDSRQGYLLKLLAPLESFPSEDLYQDTERLNGIIEDFIREYPEQYLWTHKRYKHYADKQTDFYQDYLKQHPKLS